MVSAALLAAAPSAQAEMVPLTRQLFDTGSFTNPVISDNGQHIAWVEFFPGGRRIVAATPEGSMLSITHIFFGLQLLG